MKKKAMIFLKDICLQKNVLAFIIHLSSKYSLMLEPLCLSPAHRRGPARMQGDPASWEAGTAVQVRYGRCFKSRWSHVNLESELGIGDGLDRGIKEGAKDGSSF